MNKSVKLLFCLIFCCFFMTGCVDMNASLTINKDRSADVNVKTLVEKSAYPMIRKEIDKMKKSYSGSKIVNIEKGKKVGISVTTHTPDITKVQVAGFPIAFEPNNIKYLNVKKGFFKDIFVFDNTVDCTGNNKNSQENAYMEYLTGSYMEDSHFNFTMNLPVKADDSNAGEINNGGKTLKWVLLYGEKNKLYAKFTLLNWTNIILTSVAGILLIILSVLGIIYRKPLAEKFKDATFKSIFKKFLLVCFIIIGLCLIGWGIYAGYSYYQAKINDVALYPIYENGKWGYIDETGKVVIKPQYDNFSFPQNGIIRAFTLNKKIKADDKYRFNIAYRCFFFGLEVEGYPYNDSLNKIDDLTFFDDIELEFASKEAWQNIGKQIYLDKDLKPTNYSKYYNDLIPIVINHPQWNSFPTGQEKWGYVNKKGEWLIIPQFDKVYPFSEGFAAIKMKGKWGYINKRGEYLVKPQFDEAYKFHDGMARVQKGSKYGYINQKGKLIIPPQFEDAKAFSEGLAPVEQKKKWGYIDKKGHWIINPQFESANTFSENLALVNKKAIKKPYFINKNGESILIITEQDQFRNFHNGIAIGYHGFLDKKGKYTKLFSDKDSATPIFNLFLVERNYESARLPEKYCYVNTKGKELYCFMWP